MMRALNRVSLPRGFCELFELSLRRFFDHDHLLPLLASQNVPESLLFYEPDPFE